MEEKNNLEGSKFAEKVIKREKIKSVFSWILLFPFRVLMAVLGIGILFFCLVCFSPFFVFIAGILLLVFVLVILVAILAMILWIFSKKFREEIKENI